ncbi:hypothetical protein [Thermoleptolyngbya oregonensis]|uniref:hypothetical protein n=1 Tax=Thermoleptolyngbya oregonensis TaxID=2303529 RepID=UPI002931DF36|nr:hypothetical protein [Thermoleptolyngbya oregonensis]
MAITIRAMQEADLAIADHLFRRAFGTFIRLPDPQDFARTMNYMNRWYLDPSAAFVAEDPGVSHRHPGRGDALPKPACV